MTNGTGSGRRALIAAGAVSAIVFVAGGVALYVTASVARAVVTPARKRKQDQLILGVDLAAGEITLRDSPDARVAGRYGLWFADDSGFARIGEVLRAGGGTITRVLAEVVFGSLHAPARARLSGWYYLEPEELGFPVASVPLETSLGQAPAWLIPAAGETSRWVIQVHGRGAERQEGLRAVPVFRARGYTSLVLSYRNDGDAPESDDRRYGLGGTEWLDVESAIRYARDNGATSIVLMGWSMGGAIVLQTVTRSPSLDYVDGIVLESPVIDWVNTLDYQAEMLGIPTPIAKGALRIIESQRGTTITGLSAAIDFTSMDFVSRALDLTLPTLILHSDDDGFVPSTASHALARSRPDIVTLEAFTEAKHTKLWNYDESRWTGAIGEWLDRLGDSLSGR